MAVTCNEQTTPTTDTCQCPTALQGTVLWQLYDISADNPEFCLFESLITEFADIAGFPINYYISDPNMDRLYGEDALNGLVGPIETRLVYEPSEETSIIESFGITSDETLQFALIPKKTFSTSTSAYYMANGGLSAEPWTPKPGDVIHTLWNNRKYEIVDIGAENQIFMAKKLIWELILRPFRYSEQTTVHKELHTDTTSGSFTAVPSATDGKDIENYNAATYGDNTWIEDQSDLIDPYDDVDTKKFGY